MIKVKPTLQLNAQPLSELSICAADIEKAMQRGHLIRSQALHRFLKSIQKPVNRLLLSLTAYNIRNLSVVNNFKALTGNK